MKTFDYLVIGGGSGGIASANRAGMHGAKVGLIERENLGGTCVNVGCVPKKVMWESADLLTNIDRFAGDYGIDARVENFDFKTLVENREKYIDFLHGAYDRGLTSNGVEQIKGEAKFVSEKVVEVNGQEYTADHILIAVGGEGNRLNIPGAEHAITSREFFDLKEVPERVITIGAGYIGMEISYLLHDFGAQVDVYEFADSPLASFDGFITEHLMRHIEVLGGPQVHTKMSAKAITKNEDGSLTVEFENGDSQTADLVLMATGRTPQTANLNLEVTGVEVDDRGFVKVDDFQNTTKDGIYAIGDVIDQTPLTPVAIKAGRYLSERLFNGQTDLKMDYSKIPTVVFTHPPIGSIGYTEAEAIEEFGKEDIYVYETSFTPMHAAMSNPKEQTAMKLITQGPDEVVIGLHGIGRGMDEMTQGFSVAVTMGATKAQFDATVAIHPTASEEFVTMTPAHRKEL